jgi:hypothetical protein
MAPLATATDGEVEDRLERIERQLEQLVSRSIATPSPTEVVPKDSVRRPNMAVERTPSGSSLIDVLDRVLDKGIVIDAWVRVSLVGSTW